jgi:hypothetical protein
MERKYRQTDIREEAETIKAIAAGTQTNRMCSKEIRMVRGKVGKSKEE